MLLKGITALVAGATGEVGGGVAWALSKEGAFVYLAGRSHEKLQRIQDTLPNKDKSKVIAVDYSTTEGAKTLDETVNAMGVKLDFVLASSGPWLPINKIAAQADIDKLYMGTQSNFAAQLFLYKVLTHHCKPEAQFLMLNGAAALNIVATGLTGVMANACLGAAKLMNDECSNNSDTLPNYTHVLLVSSVGHADARGSDNTNDPNEFGKAFVAMALNKHSEFKDKSGTLMLDDAMFEKLSSLLV